jgi:hypothetical protein
MHLVYLDEVKYHPKQEPYHWLCGLAFPEDAILEAEERVAQLAEGYFGTRAPTVHTEFHAKDMIHGKRAFKGQDPVKRIDYLCKLIDIIDECPGVKRIEVRIDVNRMIAGGHEQKAFLFFVEKVESLMRAEKSLAMLISDHDKDMVASNVASLSAYKAQGTPFQFGFDINHIVDTIHHTGSHYSRLIQLADVYAYCMALYPKQNLKYAKATVLEHARSKQNFGGASKYKYWPTEYSWYPV